MKCLIMVSILSVLLPLTATATGPAKTQKNVTRQPSSVQLRCFILKNREAVRSAVTTTDEDGGIRIVDGSNTFIAYYTEGNDTLTMIGPDLEMEVGLRPDRQTNVVKYKVGADRYQLACNQL